MAGAMADCHWADLSEERKQELLAALGAAESANPIRTRWEKAAAASDKASAANDDAGEADTEAASLFDDPDGDHETSSGSDGSDSGTVSRFD